jgi:PAS domain S-box-containing protein
MNELLGDSGFMPHGMCYLWRPDILVLHVVSDAFIALAYLTIPFSLVYFVRQRRDLQFHWMFVCFAIFIIACGATHVMEIITIWSPIYWVSGAIKAITALASVPTAFLLVKLLPDALRLPSPATLRREIEIRERAELEVRRANELLEARVVERTAQLEAANKQLHAEARQRQQAEELMTSNRQLLDSISDGAAALLYAKDTEGRYIFTSRHLDVLFGLKRGEIVGCTDNTLFPPETADRLREVDQRAMTGNSAIIEDEVVPLADGPHTYLSMKSALRDTAGKVFAVFGISVDITERKRLEERLRAQVERMDLLVRTVRAIGECTQLDSIYEVTLTSLEREFGLDLAVICAHEADDGSMTVNAIGSNSRALASDLALGEQSRIAFGQGEFQAGLEGRLVSIPDLSISASRFPERLARADLRSLAVVPLVINRKVIGALLCARRKIDGFSSNDLEFLTLLAQHLSLAVNHARRYDALKREIAA